MIGFSYIHTCIHTQTYIYIHILIYASNINLKILILKWRSSLRDWYGSHVAGSHVEHFVWDKSKWSYCLQDRLGAKNRHGLGVRTSGSVEKAPCHSRCSKTLLMCKNKGIKFVFFYTLHVRQHLPSCPSYHIISIHVHHFYHVCVG